MTAAMVLPPAPPRPGVAAGWHRSTGARTPPTLHRLLVRADRPRATSTVCGRTLTGPEWVSRPGGRRRIRVCGTCSAMMQRWGDRPAPLAPAPAPARTVPLAPPAASPVVSVVVPAAADPLVALMAGEGYDLDGLLDAHRDDGRSRCRACGGPQSGRVRWPCVLRLAGVRAAELRASGRGGSR